MDLLEDLKMSLLNFDFVKVLLKNHLNHLKNSTFECFLGSVTDFYFFLKKNNYFCNI